MIQEIFVSYSNFDKEKVRLISKELVGNSKFVPIVIASERESLKPLAQKVAEGIERSHVVVPILTKSSIGTQWINQEIGYASALKKRIMPIVDRDLISELKGFIHKQIDLPYVFISDSNKAKEHRDFLKQFKILLSDLETETQKLNPIQSGHLKPESSESDVICVSIERMPVVFEFGEVRLKTDAKDLTSNDPKAFVAKFQLKPRPNTKSLTVRAAVAIKSDDDDAIYFIHDGVWIRNGTAYQRLEAGGFAELVLGIRRNKTFYACERQYIHSSDNFRPIIGTSSIIRVELICSRSSTVEFTKLFAFKVELQPEFSISEVNSEPSTVIQRSSRPPDDAWKHAPDLSSQQVFMMRSFYGTEEFTFLQHDSRFDQLLGRIRTQDLDRWLEFIQRLLNRSELAFKQSRANSDVEVLIKAISAGSDEQADSILRKNGLL